MRLGLGSVQVEFVMLCRLFLFGCERGCDTRVSLSIVCVLWIEIWHQWFSWICRENEQLSKYGDTKTARGIMLGELKKLIEANPLFRDKLMFPTLRSSRLRTLINQRCVSFFFPHDHSVCCRWGLDDFVVGWFIVHMFSCSLNWQHQLCKNPRPNPDIKTLFTDHTCTLPNGPLAPSAVNQPVTTLTKPAAYPSLGPHVVRNLDVWLL